MKPPVRPRWAPLRFSASVPDGPRGTWTEREKRTLLRELRNRNLRDRNRNRDLRDPELRERLPRRSEAEIQAFLCRLRGRAAREALCGQFRHCLGQPRPRPAPIEVWLEVASVLSEGLEEAAMAAFGQVFTVAGTEPLSLSLAPPSEPPRSQSEPVPSEPRPSEPRSSQSEPVPSEPRPSGPRPLPSEPGSVQSDPLPPEPRPSEPAAVQSGAPPPEPRPLHVDFQRVYEYLGRLSRDGRGPAPPPGESLLLLALLGSLPLELGSLDLGALRNHFRGVYSDLTGPPPAPPEAPPPGLGPAPSPWAELGLSPLNLFRVPLRLLRRGGVTSG
ncbi:snRNA-activating protein complex subunit 2 [Melopsittacus undulatus]|uniref:Uncharacterized protein n=1 Tax=Melopsittacus undulatus TaxID=13146 RepID=A0A8V5HBL6_MELUD|nr:snRNA-activating protein complex subunit 2 [Melopsittacus undulatus]